MRGVKGERDIEGRKNMDRGEGEEEENCEIWGEKRGGDGLSIHR